MSGYIAASQTFNDHIKELRRRILWIFIAVSLSTAIAYTLRLRLINLLQHPLGAPLYYTSPAGSFNFTLKLSTMVGIFIALPVLVFQLLRFIEPALPIRMGKWLVAKVLGASFALASAGIAFGYFCMVPLSLRFFAKYSSTQIKPLIGANEYLSYLINILIIFALVFQIPLIVLFINRIKPLKPRRLLHYQRWVIVGSFIISVVLPFTYDPISQFIVAVPIIGLYYLSVLILAIANRRNKPRRTVPQPKVVSTAPVAPPAPPQSIAPEPKPNLLARPIDGIVHRPAIVEKRLPQEDTLRARLVSQKPKPTKDNAYRPNLSIDGISPSVSTV